MEYPCLRGLTGISCFWNLVLHARIVWRPEICYLHQALLGTGPNTHSLLAAYFGIWKDINNMIRQNTRRYPTLKKLKKVLRWKKGHSCWPNNTNSGAVYCTSSALLGCKRSVIILTPLLLKFGHEGQQHLECWRQHMLSDNLWNRIHK